MWLSSFSDTELFVVHWNLLYAPITFCPLSPHRVVYMLYPIVISQPQSIMFLNQVPELQDN